MTIATGGARDARAPFDTAQLDRMMEEAGIDVLLATSKHNAQYLMGGYRFIFFQAMDAIGHSRYLPVVVYRKGRADQTAYVGNRMETGEHQVHPFWTPAVHTTCWGSVDAAKQAAEHVKSLGLPRPRIGIEPSFLPQDSYAALTSALEGAAFVDASGLLERLRAVKRPDEIEKLRLASEKITDSMLAVFHGHGEGATKADLVQALRTEETARGLAFEYCLITIGASHNRAVTDQAWRRGEVLSLDSGGNHLGYIGDLCRMGVLGEPDAELQDLLSEVDAVQHAAFARIKAGAVAADMLDHAAATLKSLPNAACNDFFAHGMGLISHEAPFLMTNHPVAYEGVDAGRPFEAGMVLSVETTMQHPRRGFIKLEDTIVVTHGGHELLGDRGRGWNRGQA
jgi:Xaa-Pro dipeptidase